MTWIFACFLFVNVSVAQQKAIKITKETTGKERIIKENKRIKVTTTDGEKYSGRFQIQDDETILIKGQAISLIDIEKLKRNPLLLRIFTSTFMIYAGGITAGFGLIIGAFVDSSGLYLLIPGLAMMTGGIMSPNINKAYKRDKKWSYEIITIPETP